MPLRNIPQENTYAFLRGINASDIFHQNSAAAAGTGHFFERNAKTACTDSTTSFSATAATTNTAGGHWGFKEHPKYAGHFYIFNRFAATKNCANQWLQASGTCATTTVALTNVYGDDTLWYIKPYNQEATVLCATAPTTPCAAAAWLTPAWNGNAYTWDGVYGIQAAQRASGTGLTIKCLATDLAYTSGGPALLDPNMPDTVTNGVTSTPAGKATFLNSTFKMTGLNHLLFLS